MSNLIDQKLKTEGIPFGKFRLFAKLAVGGMAELFIAKQAGLAGFTKQVVIKCILPQYAQKDDFITMFLDEARIAACLNHPNVVQIYDIGLFDQIHFMAMEYIPGNNLSLLHKRLYRLEEYRYSPPYRLIATIFSQAAAALEYIHNARDGENSPLGLVHRDISPNNIMVSYEGHIKIVDFGVAKARLQESETEVGVLKGRLSYMSPEQLSGDPIDGRSDIFALGIVLYELTTNRRLFRRRSEAETIQALLSSPIPLPTSLCAGYPPMLEKIIMKALQRDPEKRFQKSETMQLALEAFVEAGQKHYGARQISELMKQLFEKEHKDQQNGIHALPVNQNDLLNLARGSYRVLPKEILQGSFQSYQSVFFSNTGQFSAHPEEQTHQSSPSNEATSKHVPPQIPHQGSQQGSSSNEATNKHIPPQIPNQGSQVQQLSQASTSHPPSGPTSAFHPQNAPQMMKTSTLNPIAQGSSEQLQSETASYGAFGPQQPNFSQSQNNLGEARKLPQNSAELPLDEFAGIDPGLSGSSNNSIVIREEKDSQNNKKPNRNLSFSDPSTNKVLWMGVGLLGIVIVVGFLFLLKPWKINSLVRISSKEKSSFATQKQIQKLLTANQYLQAMVLLSKFKSNNADQAEEEWFKQTEQKIQMGLQLDLAQKLYQQGKFQKSDQVFQRLQTFESPELLRKFFPGYAQLEMLLSQANAPSKEAQKTILIEKPIKSSKQIKAPIRKKPAKRIIRQLRPRKVAQKTIRKAIRQTHKRVYRRKPPKNRKSKKLTFEDIRLKRKIKLEVYEKTPSGERRYTNLHPKLCRRIERELRRVSGRSVYKVTKSWQDFVRQKFQKSRRTKFVFYPRAVAYIIYRDIVGGKSKSTISQKLVRYQQTYRFSRYKNK